MPAEPLSGEMSIQDMLIFAAKKEIRAIALYESLARLAGKTGHERVFLFLAGQEREHKLKIEAEYEKQKAAIGFQVPAYADQPGADVGKEKARKGGLKVVMDHCMKIEHAALGKTEA